MNSRRLSLLGTLLGAVFLGLCTLFFAFIAVMGPVAAGWPGLLLTAVAGTLVWLLGWSSWMQFQVWREDR